MATSVKRLVILANELHAAYIAVAVFQAELKRLHDWGTVCRPSRESAYQLDILKRQEEQATEKLAYAIEQASSERIAQAEVAVGRDVVYVFDGF